MNLRQLEILRAVVRHRTTVAAADELALSRPAVSNALKTMEAQAERVNNRLFPTAEAMALHKESEAIFALHAKIACAICARTAPGICSLELLAIISLVRPYQYSSHGK